MKAQSNPLQISHTDLAILARPLRPTNSLWRKGIYSGAIWLMGRWCVDLHQRATLIPYFL